MVIKRIGVLSLAKFTAVIGAVTGIFYGCMMLFISILAGAMSTFDSGSNEVAAMGAVTIVTAPIAMGIGGFVYGAIAAVIFNFVASFIGGIHLGVEMESAPENLFTTDTPA